jgi:hypothetical protein
MLMRVIRAALVGAMLLAALWMLFARGNPGGISDARYAEFRKMAAPKLLYSCTRKPTPESFLPKERECWQSGRAGCEEAVTKWVDAGTTITVEFVSGTGTASYDDLLMDARRSCAKGVGGMQPGEFEVLEGDKG